MNIKPQIHNHFDIFVEKDSVRRKVGYAENVVLDAFYQNMLDSFQKRAPRYGEGTFYKNIFLGTGKNDPITSDTKLQQQVLQRNTVIDHVTPKENNSYYEVLCHITLSPEELVGTEIAEVGIGSYNLYTRALIKDSQGNTISVTKSGEETMYIYATIYIYNFKFATEEGEHNIMEAKDFLYRCAPWDTYRYIWSTPERMLTQPITQDYSYGSNYLYAHIFCAQYLNAGNLSLLVPGECLDLNSDGKLNSNFIYAFARNCANGTRSGSPDKEKQLFKISDSISNQYCNGLDYYGYLVTYENMIFAIKTFNEVDVTGVDLGTGDNIVKEFKLPHADCFNVHILDGGQDVPCVVKSYAIDEKIPVLNAYELYRMCMDRWVNCFASIQYNDKFIIPFSYTYDDNLCSFLCGMLSADENEKLVTEYIELQVPKEIKKPAEDNKIMMYPLPDQSGIIINVWSNIPVSYVFNYDKSTGTIGECLLEVPDGFLSITKDCKHFVKSCITENGSVKGRIEIYSYTRTANEIKLNKEMRWPQSSDDSVYYWPAIQGTPYIDDKISVYNLDSYNPNLVKLIRVDFINKNIEDITAGSEEFLHVGTHHVKLPNDSAVMDKSTQNTSIIIGEDTADGIVWSEPIDLAAYAKCNQSAAYITRINAVSEINENCINVLLKIEASNSSSSSYKVVQQYKFIKREDKWSVVNQGQNICNADLSDTYNRRNVNYSTEYLNIGTKEVCISQFVASWDHYSLRANLYSRYMSGNSYQNGVYLVRDTDTHVILDQAPKTGNSIVANYQLEYVPKTSDWMIKCDSEISWGREGGL